MPADAPTGARPPVVLRIKLRYDDVDAMVQRFAPNVGKSGLFIPTKSLQPIGTEIKFELRLANDQPVLVGLGRVKAVKAPDPANPRAAFGMAIELMRVTREAREVIIRMIERRRAIGLADVAIPMPEDVESARRGDVETQPRADTAGIVSAAMAGADSAPILTGSPPVKPPAKPTTKTPATGAKIPTPAALKTQPGVGAPSDTAVTEPPVRPTPPPAPQVLTAPRPTSGPLAIARSTTTRPTAPVLAPEPARTKRPRLGDLIAKAAELSGAHAAVVVPGLDEDVDVEAAVLRARALAGASDLDDELAALRDQLAAPLVEISIEAASAELARSLGGTAVNKYKRTVGEVPALGTAEVSTGSPPPDPALAPDPSIADVDAAGVPDAIAHAADAAPIPDEVIFGAGLESGPVASADELVIESGPVVAQRPAFGQASTVIGEAIAPPPPAIPERDRRGTIPPPPPRAAVELDVAAPRPAAVVDEADAELDSFERALDAARVETGVISAPVDPELDSFERALDAARVQTGVAFSPAPDDIDELDPDDIEELPGESTQIGQVAGYADARLGTAPLATQIHLADAVDRSIADAESEDNELAASIRAAAAAYEAELAEVPEAHANLDDEEISDLDVLAEADASDADLLTSNGERESVDAAPAYAPPEYAQHEHPAVDPAYVAAPEAAYTDPDPDHQAYEQPAAPAYDASEQPAYAAHDPAYAQRAAAAYAAQEPAYAEDQAAGYEPDPNAYVAADAPFADAAYNTGPQQYVPPANLADHMTGPQQYVPPAQTEPVNEGSGAKRRPFGSNLDPVTRIGLDDDRPLRPLSAPQRAAKPVVRTPTRAVIKRRAPTPAPVRTSADDDFDFASQLDLGDDDDNVPQPPPPDVNAFNAPSEYTFAESLAYTPPAFVEPPGLDAALDFDDPHQFATQTPAKPEQRARARTPSRSPLAETARFAPNLPPPGPIDDPIDFDEPHGFDDRGPLDDLESALSTLEPDLDNLEVPANARPRAKRASTASPRLPGMPPERAPSDPPTVRPSSEARAAIQRELAQRAPDPRAPAAGDRPNRTPKRRGAPQKRNAAPPAPAPRPAPQPRAASEDDGGVLINFDDDEK